MIDIFIFGSGVGVNQESKQRKGHFFVDEFAVMVEQDLMILLLKATRSIGDGSLLFSPSAFRLLSGTSAALTRSVS